MQLSINLEIIIEVFFSFNHKSKKLYWVVTQLRKSLDLVAKQFSSLCSQIDPRQIITKKCKIYQSNRLCLRPLTFKKCKADSKNNSKNNSKIDSRNDTKNNNNISTK